MTAITKKLLAQHPDLLSEAEFSGLVTDVARLGGWTLRYHTHTARHSPKGFPDWVFLKNDPPTLLFVELKTESGRVRPDQEQWLDALGEFSDAVQAAVEDSRLRDCPYSAAPEVLVHLWRPSDWDEIVRTLTGRPPAIERSTAA